MDPFIGSGQTAIAAIKTGRHYIGYDIDKEYIQLAEKRLIGTETVFYRLIGTETVF